MNEAKEKLRLRLRERLHKYRMTRRELTKTIADQVEVTPIAAKRGEKNPEWNLYVRVLRAVNAQNCPSPDVARAIARDLFFDPDGLWSEAWGDNWRIPPWKRYYGPPRPRRGSRWHAYLERLEEKRIARLNAPLRGNFIQQVKEYLKRRRMTRRGLVESARWPYPKYARPIADAFKDGWTSQETAFVIADLLDAWELYEVWKKDSGVGVELSNARALGADEGQPNLHVG